MKKDGRREDFDREKLLAGLRSACAKRNVSADRLDAVVAEIEGHVTREERLEVPSAVIGELAVDALQGIDHIAYIRFASVYRSFADLETLKDALDALDEGRMPSARGGMQQLALPRADAVEEGTQEPTPIVRFVG